VDASPTARRTRRGLAAGICLLVSAAATACGSSTQTTATAKPSGDAHVVSVALTNDGCAPERPTASSGAVTFNVRNTDATAVTEIELRSGERILGEKENLAPGFSGSFALNLGAGTYTLYCPGAKNERADLTVTGGPAPTASGSTHDLLTQGASQYGGYIKTQVGLLAEAVKPLTAAITANDLTAAKQAYAKARPYYERVEPVAESFTSGADNLDSDIDARADDVPANTWTGFHRIEQGLFQAGSTQGLASYAQGLAANVDKLRGLVANLTYQPAELANGAVELLDEVAKTKITGEEERYSHIDVLDFQANVEGAEQAYAGVSTGLAQIDKELATTISARFAALDALLDTYRSAGALGGFVPYTQLKQSDLTAMAQDVHAVTDPLSRVASKVVNS
jgi:iron uptake system component EfeO